MKKQPLQISAEKLTQILPASLQKSLITLKAEYPQEVYLAGGTVRDLLLDRQPVDIDLTVPRKAKEWAQALAGQTKGAYVPLGREQDAARVVFGGCCVDFSSFREGAEAIDEELGKRDITINSLGVCLDELLVEREGNTKVFLPIIDPTGGLTDLEKKQVRMSSSESFVADPLRLLRVFRFAAALGFTVDGATFKAVERERQLIKRVASERVAAELDHIMESEGAFQAFQALAKTGLLWEVIPELKDGCGMPQPGSHHLDVFAHCLEALHQMEQLLEKPALIYPSCSKRVVVYLQSKRNVVRLKWAALLHDVGKPPTYKEKLEQGGRITFYNHDIQGEKITSDIGQRLRWSGEDSRVIGKMIAVHMRPFHLANVAREKVLSLKACIRLVKAAGDDLVGLFLLSMADAKAGKGEERPQEMERELGDLFFRLETVRRENVAPVQTGPSLLSGKDLIKDFGLKPGPIFKMILGRIAEAQMEGVVSDRADAVTLVQTILNQAEKTGNLKEEGSNA